MRAVGGIVAGLIADVIVTILVGFVGMLLTFTVPANVQPGDTRALFDTLANMPVAPLLALAAAWLVGAVAGAWTARRISGLGWVAWVVTILVTLYVVLNAWILPMPSWMQVVWIAAPLVGGLIGNHLARGGPTAAAAATTDAEEAPASSDARRGVA